MKRIVLVLAAGFVSSCVDPSGLVGFECDGGRCRMVDAGGATGGGGGGDATGGGGVGTGGGSTTGGGSGGGGAQVCNASTCTGCCDENGACRGGDENAACGQTGAACADCGAGARCSASICQPLKATGDSCNAGGDCSSSFCVSNVCCNSACTGACQRCDATGTEGTCSALPEATNVTACGAYACDGISGECPTTCTTSRQCATGHYCSNGSCQPLKDKGAACTASVQCTTGFCADGVCCDSACSGSCDRCNQMGTAGTCSPAASDDPGSPACGTVTCNGTLVDCPILCTSGCPMGTYCSGTYCSAVKADGVACTAANQCGSGFCADGVCCNSACGGACDSCSAANGASADGVCTLLGASRVCRNATSTCDREERCTGASPDCPSNGFVDAGVGCGSTTYTAWSACDAGASCATTGVQTRTRTDLACNGGNATCTPNTATETQACNRPSEGARCGTTTYSAYTACSYAAACSTTGSRTRTRTDPICSSGTCAAMQTTETDTAGCARTTENVSCGSPSYGSWSSCSFGSTCAETGSRTRTRTDPVCQSAACGATTATETDTSMCTRSTSGQACGTTMTGSWSACSYGSTCANSGTRSRTVTTYSCGSGNCNPSNSTENDSSACGRNTTGTGCGATEYGAWSACNFADACSNSGTRSRSVTTYACNGSGSCAASTSSETEGCSRNTNGTVCGTTAYGAWSACSYGGTCSNSGNRSRSVTTYTCNAGSCQGATGTENDASGCARNTNGTTCASTSCTACRCPACERDCTSYACNAGSCQAYSDFQFCQCGGACAVKPPNPEQ